MIEDVTAAADVLRPRLLRCEGEDGFVSIEVSPEVVHSTDRTLAVVRELRERCARPNVMVKIRATVEGVTAIRRAIAEGAVERHVRLPGLRHKNSPSGDKPHRPGGPSMLTSEKRLAVVNLYEELGSYRAVAELVGCDHKMVKAWLERQESGTAGARRPRSTTPTSR